MYVCILSTHIYSPIRPCIKFIITHLYTSILNAKITCLNEAIIQVNTSLLKYFSSCRCLFVCLFMAQQPPSGPGPPRSTRFIDHTKRRTTVGRTPLDEWSARPETSTWQHTALTIDRHPWPRWDLNPQSQQASDSRPTPSAWPLGSACVEVTRVNVSKRVEVTTECQEKLCNEGFRNPNSLQSVIRAVKSRRMGWVGNYTCMGRREVHRI